MKRIQTRILIVDDHALFREGLGRLLEAETDFQIVSRCESVRQALQVLTEKSVDLVLLDYRLDQEQGVDFLRKARDSGFDGKVIIVTAGLSDDEACELLPLGISGIFLKHDPPARLTQCIRGVLDGGTWLDSKYIQLLTQAQSRSLETPKRPFTERERVVVRSVLEGLSNKEIGQRLDISESAVKAVLQQLFNKMGVRNRSQLVRIALEQYRELV